MVRHNAKEVELDFQQRLGIVGCDFVSIPLNLSAKRSVVLVHLLPPLEEGSCATESSYTYHLKHESTIDNREQIFQEQCNACVQLLRQVEPTFALLLHLYGENFQDARDFLEVFIG